jgi:hypothetical protein
LSSEAAQRCAQWIAHIESDRRKSVSFRAKLGATRADERAKNVWSIRWHAHVKRGAIAQWFTDPR